MKGVDTPPIHFRRCRAYFISKAKTCSRTNPVVVALLQLVSRRSEERRRRKLVGRLVGRRFSFLQRFVQWRNPLYRILTPPLRQALPPALLEQHGLLGTARRRSTWLRRHLGMRVWSTSPGPIGISCNHFLWTLSLETCRRSSP